LTRIEDPERRLHYENIRFGIGRGVPLPFRPIFFWRYLIGAAVPLSLVIVHAAQKLPDTIFKISIVLVILLSISADFLTLARYPYGFKQVYEQNIIGKISPSDKIVTVLPSFAEVLYYRNRFQLTNEIIVLPEGLVQSSGKSLLDTYAQNGLVTVDEKPIGDYIELRPGPTLVR